jgi:hypothetical protein
MNFILMGDRTDEDKEMKDQYSVNETR